MKTVNATKLFDSIESAAAADYASMLTARDVVLYMAAMNALPPMPNMDTCKSVADWDKSVADFKADKENVAKFRLARATMAARKVGPKALASFMMDANKWSALPEGEFKDHRVRAMTAGRQAVQDLKARQRYLVNKMFAEIAAKDGKGAAAGNITKGLLDTFNDAAKTITSRNQRTEEFNAGDVSKLIEELRAAVKKFIEERK